MPRPAILSHDIGLLQNQNTNIRDGKLHPEAAVDYWLLELERVLVESLDSKQVANLKQYGIGESRVRFHIISLRQQRVIKPGSRAKVC